MKKHFWTRMELSYWNLIISMLTELQYIRAAQRPQLTNLKIKEKFLVKIIVWIAAGFITGFGISAFHAYFL